VANCLLQANHFDFSINFNAPDHFRDGLMTLARTGVIQQLKKNMLSGEIDEEVEENQLKDQKGVLGTTYSDDEWMDERDIEENIEKDI